MEEHLEQFIKEEINESLHQDFFIGKNLLDENLMMVTFQERNFKINRAGNAFTIERDGIIKKDIGHISLVQGRLWTWVDEVNQYELNRMIALERASYRKIFDRILDRDKALMIKKDHLMKELKEFGMSESDLAHFQQLINSIESLAKQRRPVDDIILAITQMLINKFYML